jgi:hypothetical protein
MEKVNFTDAGLQQLLQELYLLAPPQLQQEALIIQSDLRLWLKDHFIFNPSQLEDLDNMDTAFLEDIGIQLAYFVLHRLPITLNKAEAPASLRKEDRGKLYRNEQKTATSYLANTGQSITQTLSFSIEYLIPMNS